MSNPIRRVYPIRKSRNKWFIRLFSYHDCNSHSNEDEKCNKRNCIEDTLINISEFDITNPRGISGPLVNENEIVIADKKINIIFDYPLINIACISICSKNPLGFTLKELVLTVKSLYQHIYDEEEKTAPERTYDLEKLCEFCVFDKSPLENYIIDLKQFKPEEECPICYSEFDKNESIASIRCGHSFHRKCVQEWINFNGKTCPVCRTQIKECQDCNGKLVINFSYTGTVIPLDKRGIILNRNLTNGKYGIYGYDLDNLFLEGFWYDKKNKNLRLFVIS
jgi:hypothetical protein